MYLLVVSTIHMSKLTMVQHANARLNGQIHVHTFLLEIKKISKYRRIRMRNMGKWTFWPFLDLGLAHFRDRKEGFQ